MEERLRLVQQSAASPPVPVGRSNANVPMVKPAQDWQGEHAAVDPGEKIVGLMPLALVAPQLSHAHRRSQFPG
jgi:hypothetical protein